MQNIANSPSRATLVGDWLICRDSGAPARYGARGLREGCIQGVGWRALPLSMALGFEGGLAQKGTGMAPFYPSPGKSPALMLPTFARWRPSTPFCSLSFRPDATLSPPLPSYFVAALNVLINCSIQVQSNGGLVRQRTYECHPQLWPLLDRRLRATCT
jgi:hypothetical protein